MERCIKEFGINRGTVSFAWKELGGADRASVQAESAKEITGRIREWIEGHRDFPSIEECSKNLGVCKAVVSKYWVAAGGNKRSASDFRSEHRFIAMANWLIEHPDAGYDKCAEALEDNGTNFEFHRHNYRKSKKRRTMAIYTSRRNLRRLLPGTGHTSSQGRQLLVVCNLWLENGYR